MELKQNKRGRNHYGKASSNCTNMELKRGFKYLSVCYGEASNCTNMELKHVIEAYDSATTYNF